MRLLPVRADHVGGRAARRDAKPRRFRHRRCDGGKHLSLRHLCAHPRRHQAGGFGSEVLKERAMTVAARLSDVSRRSLLTGALTGGFLFAFHLPVRALNEPVQPPDSIDGKFAPNALIRIDEAGHITLVMPQVEMGQGVYTAIAMILAEELDADIAQVILEHAPPNDKLYGNPLFGLQVTGNSNSIRSWWSKLRAAGAGARAMLVQAAAKKWQVDPTGCTASKSEVTHKDSGRKLSYGELASAAASETPPKDV